MGALSENGPCFVGNDSNSTYLNPWSWNNEVNILYIDQPNQVGFSYDTATNVTVTLTSAEEMGLAYEAADFSDGIPEHNLTFTTATTGTQNVSHTANSTTHAAVALWHFAQTWFEEFPHYKPHDEQISLFTESYGGHYGPGFASFFVRQNELIANGTICGPGTHYLHINTLGLVNACIDMEEQSKSYATFPVNNTYGIQAFTEPEYHRAMYALQREGGGIDRIRECQRLQSQLDRFDHGDVKRVNEYCIETMMVADNVSSEYYISKHQNGWYDITHPGADSFPAPYLTGFLNQQWVQRALGVPVNHTAASSAVYTAFTSTGDIVRAGLLEDIGYLLDHGVKVAML